MVREKKEGGVIERAEIERRKRRGREGVEHQKTRSGLIMTVDKKQNECLLYPDQEKSKENHNKIKKTNKPDTRIYHVR